MSNKRKITLTLGSLLTALLVIFGVALFFNQEAISQSLIQVADTSVTSSLDLNHAITFDDPLTRKTIQIKPQPQTPNINY